MVSIVANGSCNRKANEERTKEIMSVFQDLIEKKTKLSLVGLGYVGMPIAVEFAKHVNVVGFDINESKIERYKRGEDPTCEVGNEAIAATTMEFTHDPVDLEDARFHIVAVPTPINLDKTPDLSPVISASEILGKHLMPGSIVVYESTVYPGVTEDVCVPILERESGLVCGRDFTVGYSPERINPGDKVHTLVNIKKIVSGQNEETLQEISNVYNTVIKAGTYPVSSIKTAEAVKVVENSQRDVNIAFVNEIAMALDRMGIDTAEVIDGMNTKWNALGFRPGLVGGHCIGVDPYYFTYEAELLGYHSQIISAARRINDGMGEYVANATIKEMVKAGLAPASAKVGILGITFKENCPDVRNSKVMDIILCLHQYGISPLITDPVADPIEVKAVCGVELVDFDCLKDLDCVILAVSHDAFKELGAEGIKGLLKKTSCSRTVVIDVKVS